MRRPTPDVRCGARIERAAWMKHISALYWRVYDTCMELNVIGEAADNIATNACDFMREFGAARAKRTVAK